jgi:hypothetical protein
MGRDGTGWDGMGRDGTGWDGMKAFEEGRTERGLTDVGFYRIELCGRADAK